MSDDFDKATDPFHGSVREEDWKAPNPAVAAAAAEKDSVRFTDTWGVGSTFSAMTTAASAALSAHSFYPKACCLGSRGVPLLRAPRTRILAAMTPPAQDGAPLLRPLLDLHANPHPPPRRQEHLPHPSKVSPRAPPRRLRRQPLLNQRLPRRHLPHDRLLLHPCTLPPLHPHPVLRTNGRPSRDFHRRAGTRMFDVAIFFLSNFFFFRSHTGT